MRPFALSIWSVAANSGRGIFGNLTPWVGDSTLLLVLSAQPLDG